MRFRRPYCIMLLCALGLLPPLPAVTMGTRTPVASLENDVRQLNHALLAFFRPNFLLPITIPAGQAVGDVYDSETWVLAERASTCFPALPEARRGPTTLPTLTSLATRQAGLAFGLATIVDLDGEMDVARTVEIRFQDARYAEVSAGDLRRALSGACEQLRPIVEERREKLDPARKPPIIIGTLVSARKQVFIGVRNGQRLSAKADALRATLAAAGGTALAAELLPIDVRVAVSGEFGMRQGIVIEAKEASPVAFKPAFVMDLIAAERADNAARGPAGGSPGAEPAWTSFDPDNPEHRRIFEAATAAYLQAR